MRASVSVSGVEIMVEELQYLHTRAGRQLARITLKAGLNVIGKQMQRDLDPKVKEAGKSVGSRVTIYRQNVTRAKVGFNVGKNARKLPFRRQRTSKGGVGIGPANIHWYIAGTASRFRYGNQGTTTDTGKPLSLRQKRYFASKTSAVTTRSTGTMPAQQPGLAADAARKSLSQVKAVMARAGKSYLAARAKKIEAKAAKARVMAAQRRLSRATGKG